MPALAPDRRKRPDQAQIDAILRRARWLDPDDAALLRAVYEQARPVAEIARLLDVDPRSVRRRVRILSERVLHPRFLVAARVVRPDADLRRLVPEPDPAAWPPNRRRVAEAMVIRGLNMRDASIALGLSLHTVRRHIDAIHALADAAPLKGAA